MLIQKAEYTDIKRISELYYQARIFMAISGNKNQWICGYPSDDVIRDDIEKGHLFVVKENGVIEAAFVYMEGVDETYNEIDGCWLNDEEYSAVHRVVSSGKISGVTCTIFNWCKERCSSIRIDTHDDNTVMQKALLNNGFTYCGTIITHNGTPRMAFQWIKN